MKRYSRKRRKSTKGEKYRRDIDSDSSFNGDDDDDDTGTGESNGFGDMDNEALSYDHFEFGVSRQLTSSPVLFLNEQDGEHNNFSSNSEHDSTKSIVDPLFPGSTTSTCDFTQNFLDIKIKTRVSDAAAGMLLKLFSDSLPTPNHCPSLYNLKRSLINDKCVEIKRSNYSYYLLDLKVQLEPLIEENPDIFSFFHGNMSDITNAEKFTFVDSSDTKYVYVLLNVDGLSSVFSSKSYKIWPVLGTVLNLPPGKRNWFRNVLFFVLYYGEIQPDFQEFLRLVVDKVNSFSLRHLNFTIKIKIVTLCADLPAKAKSLNMMSFNGYFGCTVCKIRGFYSSCDRKMIFPFDDLSELRAEQSHIDHVNESIRTGSVCFGVKGTTPLSDIMNVPITPFDPMHLLFLGIVRSIFMHIFSHKLIGEHMIDAILQTVSVPACFKRKPRSLVFKSKFKANEWKHLILYFCSSFFISSHDSIKLLLLLLSTFIRLLFKCKITETDRTNATELIATFRNIALETFGDSVQTYSMHAIQHLPLQVKHFGGLWAVSAETFESCFGQLKRLVTGTRSEGSLIVNRFLLTKCIGRGEMNCVSNSGVKVIGPSISIPVEKMHSLSVEYELPISIHYRFYHRFQFMGKVFHSFMYSRKQSSASYYVSLQDDRFARIDHIIVANNAVLCLCTQFQKLHDVTELIRCIPRNVKNILKRNCQTFVVTENDKFVCSAESILSHLIIISVRGTLFATPVIELFDIAV